MTVSQPTTPSAINPSIRHQHSSATPLVSVVCLAYNQERFIGHALESFTNQETTFPFEVIVHDDASTDGTLQVVRRYQSMYPDIFKVIAQTSNQYSMGVGLPAKVFAHARGAYLAYCDGDDHWTDKRKLQTQADVLDAHPEIGLVFTDADVYFETSRKMITSYNSSRGTPIPSGDVRRALLAGNPYRSCTAMFRAEAIEGYDTIAKKLRPWAEDWVMWLHISRQYQVAYLDLPTATYRVLDRSASHLPSMEQVRRYHRANYRVRVYYNNVFGLAIDKRELKRHYRGALMEICFARKLYREATKYAATPVELVVSLLRAKRRWLFRRLMERRTA